nr:Ubiquitin-associated and SH3 domain-containing protein [Ipomoea batatas]GMD29798.1 Ubiquitin-associated and SH3 domain-containing protein [Ipomoea batatas]
MVNSDGRQLFQNVVVMRHGPRLDNFDKLWAATADRPWDPPLYSPGKSLAFDAGKKIREEVGAPIHRVFVSPFLRCLQTASETIRALSDESNTTGAAVNPPKIKLVEIWVVGSHHKNKKKKVSVEFGLSEMLNTIAIRPKVAPKDGDFKFVISQCETHLPPGTIDHTAEQVYKKLPEWQETQADARARYLEVLRALADKYPSENLLLITHGEGVLSVASAFMEGDIKWVEYCGYSHLRRAISPAGESCQSFAGEDFTAQSEFGFTFHDSSAKPSPS